MTHPERRQSGRLADSQLHLPCRAVLFDCDGVLVDSKASGEAAWRQWALDHRLDPGRVLDGVHGRRSRDTVLKFLPPERLDAALAAIENLEIDAAVETVPIGGARALLTQLPAPWAVVTSASRALARARLAAAGLPDPPVLISAEAVGRGKPAPDGYLCAARRLDIPIAACTVVEDSVNGVQAGQAAGAAHILGISASALETSAETVSPSLEGVRWDGTGLLVPARTLLRPSLGSRAWPATPPS